MELTNEEYQNLLLTISDLEKRVDKLEEQTGTTGVITTNVPKFVQDFLNSKKEATK